MARKDVRHHLQHLVLILFILLLSYDDIHYLGRNNWIKLELMIVIDKHLRYKVIGNLIDNVWLSLMADRKTIHGLERRMDVLRQIPFEPKA